MLERIVSNWKTTAGGLLSIAGVILTALSSGNPNQKWIATATLIVAGLTGLLGKDK